jgi:hypothetical protein
MLKKHIALRDFMQNITVVIKVKSVPSKPCLRCVKKKHTLYKVGYKR